MMTGMSCFGFWDSIHPAKSRKDIYSTLHVLTKSLLRPLSFRALVFCRRSIPLELLLPCFNSREVGELCCYAFSPKDGEIGVGVIPLEGQLSTSLLRPPDLSKFAVLLSEYYSAGVLFGETDNDRLVSPNRFAYSLALSTHGIQGRSQSQCMSFGSFIPGLALSFGPASFVGIDGVGQTRVSVPIH